jgi:hypothetical protein
MKSKELEAAVKLIEDHGGIVMLPDTGMQEYEETQELLKQKEIEEQKELESWQKERAKTLKSMQKDFDQMIGDPCNTMTDIEDMIHGHGCDLDDLEELIHSYY